MKTYGSSIEATDFCDPIEITIWGRDAVARGLAKPLRERAGLTQRDVAEHVGVAPLTIYTWESGRHRPLGERARRYFELLVRLEISERLSACNDVPGPGARRTDAGKEVAR